MKKVILFTVFVFIGSIIIVMFARYSSRTAVIAFEWIALLSCISFIIFTSWAGSKYFYSRKKEKEDFFAKPSAEVAEEFGISKRELEVLQLVAEGFSNKEISEKLFVSESTIKKHISNIFSKLDAKRRTEAIKIAYQKNLISADNFVDSN